ncbi:hypothetical protein E2C01_095653 [Portunus trituberculatus]|uniref:Uncharacterized protein n=1 Tax=Portunus trituberculatus TaxID=210409 RepID=A0A5B7K6B1_PORTR|nr:hypothetical protein [Portunus trituberculatus]
MRVFLATQRQPARSLYSGSERLLCDSFCKTSSPSPLSPFTIPSPNHHHRSSISPTPHPLSFSIFTLTFLVHIHSAITYDSFLLRHKHIVAAHPSTARATRTTQFGSARPGDWSESLVSKVAFKLPRLDTSSPTHSFVQLINVLFPYFKLDQGAFNPPPASPLTPFLQTWVQGRRGGWQGRTGRPSSCTWLG